MDSWIYPNTPLREFDLSGYMDFDSSGCLGIPEYPLASHPLASKTRKLIIHRRENDREQKWFRGELMGWRVEGCGGVRWRSGEVGEVGGESGSPTFAFDLSGYTKFDLNG